MHKIFFLNFSGFIKSFSVRGSEALRKKGLALNGPGLFI
jgi:hypothetical protein